MAQRGILDGWVSLQIDHPPEMDLVRLPELLSLVPLIIRQEENHLGVAPALYFDPPDGRG